MIRVVTVEERRAALVRRHRLAGDADGPAEVVGALLALHATDPASVYLSVLARAPAASIADVSDAMYRQRTLVRWLAMRRTLFLFARDDIPMIQSAASTPLAAALRRRLLSRLERNGIDPPVDDELPGWLAATEERIEEALRRRGSATGAEMRTDEPNLRATIRPGTRSDQPMGLTSPLLALMSAEGRIVRSTPVGAWTTRNHRWEPTAAWWPDGIPPVDPAEAQASLARRWLQRFGPAQVEDLEWWTGWNKTTTRAALSRLDVEEVDLHGRPGIDLRTDPHDPRRHPSTVASNSRSDRHDAAAAPPGKAPGTPGSPPAEPATPAAGPATPAAGPATPAAGPVACLLPCLDPTPMGWKHRDWYTAVDPALLYDRAGNIGPTIWWQGEIIGGWASTAGGIRTKIVADRGADATAAVERAAALLQDRLGDIVIVPSFRTPLERDLSEIG